MIKNNYNKTFTVYRQEWTTETEGDETFDVSAEVEVGELRGHIQQVSQEYALSLGFTMTKPYAVWCDISEDVMDGDMITNSDGKYAVKGKIARLNGYNKHIELMCEWYGDIVEPNS